MRNLVKSIFVLILLVAAFKGEATHLRAGEIVVERVNCQSLTFRITIIVYTDLESPVIFGNGILRFGDGSDPDPDVHDGAGIQIPEIESDPRFDLGANVGRAQFTIEHTYGSPGRYIISYFEHNRNDGIRNVDNSVNTPFFIEAEINIDPFLGCNNSPVLLIPPIDKACPGVAFYHNPGAYDPDGDSLSFELIIPKKDVGTEVDNYRDPTSPEFFNELSYLNEAGTGPPTISINPVTGEVKWDTPGDQFTRQSPAEYNIAFIVREWREINGEWFPLGYVVRDMQIIVEGCENDRPELIVPEDTCIVAGTNLEGIIRGVDVNYDLVSIEAYSQILSQIGNPATYSPEDTPPPLQSTLPPSDTANVVFNWQTDCSHVRDQPYQIVFKITDYPENGPKLVSFKTWNITVIAPSPEWDEAVIDFPRRGVSLNWNAYPCTNARAIQIYRRVDSYAYEPGFCETGMPSFLGYELIDQVAPGDNSYFDNNNGRGLDFGAAYCYRLVASFGTIGGGQSIISQEICLDPIPAEAPVITNVTVDRTSVNEGSVTVSWMPPFDLDTQDFGFDYRYVLQRGNGLFSDIYQIITETKDTTFTDTGFDTESLAYNYRLVLYSDDATVVSPQDPIDTSSTASTVRLEPRPLFEQIDLTWIADVPWSNNSQNDPWHYIYRGLEGEGEENLVLIDSVNVNVTGFSYLDDGSFNDTPLNESQVYCYYVVTQGTYGNDKIFEPLINKSQMVCAQPSDEVAPCVPVITVEGMNCEEFINQASCDFNQFENVLTWEQPVGGECQDDVNHYDIYVAASESEALQYYTTVYENSFVDSELPSFARCYQVVAVDRSGNKSEPTERICFDNCPNYELPNVFTPGNGDGCNDFFSAYSDRQVIGENGETECGVIDRSKCARFVESVVFKVYNRWGKKVYEYQSGGENTIYIDWDGRGSNGRELSSGSYYYHAEVTFDLADSENRIQDMKGWIQLMR